MKWSSVTMASQKNNYIGLSSLQDAIASQPLSLHFLEAIAIANTFAYFAHWLAHTLPFLWRFHSVHHSSEELD
jgi:sterol desaturase/sphingolipid hydroxylase (fatty acid hydroxylase superfamily)